MVVIDRFHCSRCASGAYIMIFSHSKNARDVFSSLLTMCVLSCVPTAAYINLWPFSCFGLSHHHIIIMFARTWHWPRTMEYLVLRCNLSFVGFFFPTNGVYSFVHPPRSEVSAQFLLKRALNWFHAWSLHSLCNFRAVRTLDFERDYSLWYSLSLINLNSFPPKPTLPAFVNGWTAPSHFPAIE